MRKKILIILLNLVVAVCSLVIKAQSCPTLADVNLTTSTMPRTCGSNGSITASFSPYGFASNVTVQLLKSGAIQSA